MPASQPQEVNSILSAQRTPFYLCDLNVVSHNLRRLSEILHIEYAHIFYSLKTNDNDEVLRFLKGSGVNVEVESGIELKRARSIGFKQIVFNGPAKEKSEIRLAIEECDTIIVIDNISELHMLVNEASKEVRCLIRLNTSSSKLSKFGFSICELQDALKVIQNNQKIRLIGLHFHMGSFINSANAYVSAFDTIISAIKILPHELLKNFELISVGGGIPCEQKVRRSFIDRSFEIFPRKYNWMENYLIRRELEWLKYVNTFSLDSWLMKASTIIQKCKSSIESMTQKKICLIIEPGTAIINDAVDLFSTVIVRKDNKLLIDASRFIEHGHQVFWHPVINVSRVSAEIQKEYIYGPLGTRNDLFSRCYIGKPLQPEDRIMIKGMGAYTFSTQNSFGRAHPKFLIKQNYV